ncbi:MAG: hypothetical protein BGO76_00315 [Caedibacter sp. 38-128]|nr:MAG: hypothetical protein BGO76_00315 [Caedibacter sp. 38-128]
MNKNLFSNIHIYRHIFPNGLGKEKGRLSFSLFLVALAKICSIGGLFAYKYGIDFLLHPSQESTIYFIYFIMIYGFLRIISVIAIELRGSYFTAFSQNVMKRLGIRVFEHLHSLSLSYHLNRRIGSISIAIEKGLKALEFLAIFSFFYAFPLIIEILTMCIIFFYIFSYKISLVSLLTVISYMTYTVYIVKKRIINRREMNHQNSLLHSMITESLINYETIKLFNREEKETEKIINCLEKYKYFALLNFRDISSLNIGQNIIIICGTVLINIILATNILSGSMSIGGLVFANMFLLQIYTPMNSFGLMYREIKQALIDIEQFLSILNEDQEVKDAQNAKSVTKINGVIEFNNVTFGYSPQRPVLDNVSFILEKGKTLAIVGPSGSGKTTIVRLLCRFFDVWSGSIKINDIDIKNISQNSLRKLIGVVPQNTTLFNESIVCNITSGNLKQKQRYIKYVLKSVNLDSWVEKLPQGYNTIVGEQGMKLSGGEKQRLGIARLIMKDPFLIIFDEATSHLDYQNEWIVQENVKKITKGKSTIIIAHRLSTIIDADEILYFNKGKIIERGTHDFLLKIEGEYSKMWYSQFKDNKHITST